MRRALNPMAGFPSGVPSKKARDPDTNCKYYFKYPDPASAHVATGSSKCVSAFSNSFFKYATSPLVLNPRISYYASPYSIKHQTESGSISTDLHQEPAPTHVPADPGSATRRLNTEYFEGRGRPRHPCGVGTRPRVYRFSKTERIPGKCPFTRGSDPQNRWYKDNPLLVWEEGPSPPNDDEIADQCLSNCQFQEGIRTRYR